MRTLFDLGKSHGKLDVFKHAEMFEKFYFERCPLGEEMREAGIKYVEDDYDRLFPHHNVITRDPNGPPLVLKKNVDFFRV